MEYLTSVPYRDTEHKADKAAAVEVIGTIMGGMVKQFGDILKHSAEFWSYGVIYTEKNRLGALAIGNQRIPSPV